MPHLEEIRSWLACSHPGDYRRPCEALPEFAPEPLKQWKLEDLETFIGKLRADDEVAVEVTGNTRLFHDAVAPHVAQVVAVNPNQFQVITYSVKKTDPNDARNLALYLAKDLLRKCA